MELLLQIVRYEGPVRKDKLVIMYKEAKPEETDPKKSFLTEGVTCKIILPMITVSPTYNSISHLLLCRENSMRPKSREISTPSHP